MSRFEIQDIISQDKKGIVFRAYDSEKKHPVALRRFFPFGQSGGGLSPEEAAAFSHAAEKLNDVSHNSLRSVIAGSVDPIDGMPYIVAEWIDGAPLDTILDGGKLDPPLVIEVLWLALEVSIALSKELGEESVWVETEADSIFVGSEETHRGFVFWLSPFKWLGAESNSRNLASIAELGERLAGWDGKLISDQAGNGLGGWLKWLKNNPDIPLAEALETLASRTNSSLAPPAKPTPSLPPIDQSSSIVKSKSRLPTPIIAIGVFLLLVIAGLAIYKMVAKAPSAPPLVDPIVAAESTPEVKAPKSAPKSPPKAAQDDEEIAASRINERAAELAREREAKRIEAKEVAPKKSPAATPAASKKPKADVAPDVIPASLEFTPEDGNKFKEIKQNNPASLTGVLLKVSASKQGKSLYFEFSDPPVTTEIKAVAHKSEHPDNFTPEAYSDLIGKKLRFDGTVFREPSGKQYVKVISRDKITVVK